VELFPEERFVIHGAERDAVALGGSFGRCAVDARGGGHVEPFRGADEPGVVDFYEVAFLVVLKDGSGGAVGFIADDEIEVRHAVEELGAADAGYGMVGGEDDGHVRGVVAFLHLVGEALGIGGGRVLQFVGVGLDDVLVDDVLVLGTLAALFPDLGIGADGEGAEREGALLGPLGEGLGKEVQAGDEEEHALARSGDVLGDFQGGERLAGAAGHDELASVGGFETEQDIGASSLLVAGPVGVNIILGFECGSLAGGVFFPVYLAAFEIHQSDLADGRGLLLQGMLGVVAPIVGGGDDDAVGKRFFAGGGEEAIDVGFLDPVILGVALALDGVEFLGSGDFGDEVDAGVLGDFSVIVRPIRKQPDIGIEVRVFWLVTEVGADQLFEVGAFFPLGLGYTAVCGEDFLERGHAFRKDYGFPDRWKGETRRGCILQPGRTRHVLNCFPLPILPT